MSKTTVIPETIETDESLITKLIQSRQTEIDEETKAKAKKVGKFALIGLAAAAAVTLVVVVAKAIGSDEDSDSENSDDETED